MGAGGTVERRGETGQKGLGKGLLDGRWEKEKKGKRKDVKREFGKRG